MIPAAFDYVRPSTLDEAVSALGSAGEDAKLLAGGQSLLPLLRLRLAYPSVVVDLGRVEELRGIRVEGSSVVIGAMTTHHDVMHSADVREHVGLLADATSQVADPAVRHRGTLGGALAHADPAGDLPAVALALDAVFRVAGPGGAREVPASEFFQDYLETALQPGELLTAVAFPSYAGWGFRYEKFHRVAQAWAIVAAAVAVKRSNGSIGEARVALTNMGTTPVRCSSVEAALAGGSASAETVAAAAQSAAEGSSPSSDLNAKADYREHLARVLTKRAVLAAANLS